LGALGLAIPKVLVPVGGRPLLARQIDYLAEQGVERVVVNAHHLAESIQAFAQEHVGPVQLTVVTEPKLLGTAGSVRNALALLGQEPFLVLYGDVVVDQPLAPMVAHHLEHGPAATVAVYESRIVEDKGTVAVDAEGCVTRFLEKDPNVRPPALINAGLYVLEPGFLAPLPLGVELDFGYDVFPSALGRGVRILAHRLRQPVLDVGTPDGLALAQARAGS
jgi:NDP-sugar pyrophosphorylase family protein